MWIGKFGGAAQPGLNSSPKFESPSFGFLFHGRIRVEFSSLPGLARLFGFVLYQLKQAKFLPAHETSCSALVATSLLSVGWRSLAPERN